MTVEEVFNKHDITEIHIKLCDGNNMYKSKADDTFIRVDLFDSDPVDGEYDIIITETGKSLEEALNKAVARWLIDAFEYLKFVQGA
jgi:cellulose biosynthesis protein BcsQ